jgi:DNA-binding response OmpR family regulator
MEKNKIMIIDDDKELLSELDDLLSSNGYNVITDSGESDIQGRIIDIVPDIILLDLKLTKTSGFNIYNELRKSPETKNIPIILITGVYTEKEHTLVIRAFSNNNYMLKPFEPLELINKIETVLKKNNLS